MSEGRYFTTLKESNKIFNNSWNIYFKDIRVNNELASYLNLKNIPGIFNYIDLLPENEEFAGGMSLLYGKKGTYTSLHHDWRGSQWLIILSGKKIGQFLPYQAFKFLEENYKGNIEKWDSSHLKFWQKLLTNEYECIEGIINATKLLIFTNGTLHTFRNLEDTLAIAGVILNMHNIFYVTEDWISEKKSGEIPYMDVPLILYYASKHFIDNKDYQNKRKFYENMMELTSLIGSINLIINQPNQVLEATKCKLHHLKTIFKDLIKENNKLCKEI